jgi:hypothetical protein
MNEPIPPITPVETTAPTYKDRSTGLMIFGILTLLLGGLCGLFILLMLAGQASLARMNPAQANVAAILPAVAIYGVLAVALIWLGIGSIQARRWARALLLIFSWSDGVHHAESVCEYARQRSGPPTGDAAGRDDLDDGFHVCILWGLFRSSTGGLGFLL